MQIREIHVVHHGEVDGEGRLNKVGRQQLKALIRQIKPQRGHVTLVVAQHGPALASAKFLSNRLGARRAIQVNALRHEDEGGDLVQALRVIQHEAGQTHTLVIIGCRRVTARLPEALCVALFSATLEDRELRDLEPGWAYTITNNHALLAVSLRRPKET